MLLLTEAPMYGGVYTFKDVYPEQYGWGEHKGEKKKKEKAHTSVVDIYNDKQVTSSCLSTIEVHVYGSWWLLFALTGAQKMQLTEGHGCWTYVQLVWRVSQKKFVFRKTKTIKKQK